MHATSSMMQALLIPAVEDDENLLAFLCDALEDEGYHVLACTNASEAVIAITREHPAAVILDLWMQARASGWEVCAALAGDPSTASIPIILSTAAGPGRREPPASLHPQYLAYLDKPYALTDLLRAIAAALAA